MDDKPRHLEPADDGEPTSGGRARTGDQAVLAELLRRSARGDEQAFAQLYDATSARVYGLALRVVRDPAQAQEVTQEAYLETWRTASRFDPAKGSAISWLMTIAHRKGVDRVRSAEAASRRDTGYHDANSTVDHDSTADAAETSFEARRVRTALKGLTDRAARGHHPRLLRRLHAYRGGHDARPPGRHGQDPDPRRTDPVERRTGSRR